MNSRIKYLFFTLLIFLIDRLVKFFVNELQSLNLWLVKVQAPVINNNFSLSLPLNNRTSIIIGIIGILVIVYFLSKTPNTHKYYYLAIIGAALSNIFDRVIYGGVIDYLNLLNLSLLNLADVIIFVSAVVLVFKSMKLTEKG